MGESEGVRRALDALRGSLMGRIAAEFIGARCSRKIARVFLRAAMDFPSASLRRHRDTPPPLVEALLFQRGTCRDEMLASRRARRVYPGIQGGEGL